jgi:hypothetical protein
MRKKILSSDYLFACTDGNEGSNEGFTVSGSRFTVEGYEMRDEEVHGSGPALSFYFRYSLLVGYSSLL